MKRVLTAFVLTILIRPAAPQSAPPPVFEIAEIRPSATSANAYVRSGMLRGGRYEIRNATLLDLIRIAYSQDRDRIPDGPPWLDTERFDISAKVPAETTPETQRLMLQSLLRDRFSLVAHKDTKRIPGYALSAGGKLQIKEADGSGDTGCRPKAAPGSAGPGTTIEYSCRNITMAAFAEGLRGMRGSNLGYNPVSDETGLKGRWDFDVSWSLPANGPATVGDRITVFGALERQLGLKLEPAQVSTVVLVVDGANRKPADNPPGAAEALPPIPAATEFEVAEIKPTAPGTPGGRYQMLPGGRVNIRGMTLKYLIERAWQIEGDDKISGAPKFVDTDRFDIVAKLPASAAAESAPDPTAGSITQPLVDMNSVNAMLRNLLIERFRLAVHTEDRPVTTFVLTAVKPKLRKADPSRRTEFYEGPGPDGKDPRTANPAASRLVTCRNMTTAQFAENLPRFAVGYIRGARVADETGMEGSWDITLNFSTEALALGAVPSPRPGGGLPAASEPSGGITLAEAIEKQLGLKLEMTKRPGPVLVIDHVEAKPTEN